MTTTSPASPGIVVTDEHGREYLLTITRDSPEDNARFRLHRYVDGRWMTVIDPEESDSVAIQAVLVKALLQYCADIRLVLRDHGLE